MIRPLLIALAAWTVVSGPVAGEDLPPPLPQLSGLPADWDPPSGLSLPAPSPAAPSLPAPLVDPASDILDGTGGLPIGEAIVQYDDQPPPLAAESAAWYRRPWIWLTRGWQNNAEFGLDGSSGNAQTLATQLGLEMKRLTDRYTVAIDIDYRQASARDVVTEDNARFNYDFDRLLGDSKWSAFTKTGLEYDEFKAFDLRLNLNGGLAYNFVRDSDTQVIGRAGAGVSKEFDSPDDRWKPEALFGGELSHQISKRQKIKAKLDYFPVFDDWSDFRLVADASWETLVGSSENFSLRLAITDRYDSTPAGLEPNDFYYSVLLLYKF